MSRPTSKRRKMTDAEIHMESERRLMHTIAQRASFYRANPHRFAKDYLNLELRLFQQIIIFMMNVSTNVVLLASRGLGKSFLIAVFCVTRCILYPGSKVIVTSKTRAQAYEVIDKVEKELMPRSALLRSEINIKKSSFSVAGGTVMLWNNSYIQIVTANDNSRHYRGNVLCCDEYRMIDLDTINTVLRNFLVGARSPGYLTKPEYKHLAERNIEMYASSCWYSSHWSYHLAESYMHNMMDENRRYFICGLPYQLPVKEGMQDLESIEDKMSEPTFSAVKFQMESEALWYSDNDGGLYNYSDISRTCKIDYPMLPASIAQTIHDGRFAIRPKARDEIRILSADLALMGSTGGKQGNNDATAIFINQMTPTMSGRYLSNIVYTTNFEGVHTEDQALTIRKMFEEFDCDYLVIDSKGEPTPPMRETVWLFVIHAGKPGRLRC